MVQAGLIDPLLSSASVFCSNNAVAVAATEVRGGSNRGDARLVPRQGGDGWSRQRRRQRHGDGGQQRRQSGSAAGRWRLAEATTGQRWRCAVYRRSSLGEGDTSTWRLARQMPSVRCSPAFFTKFCEHLTMSQCRRISELGFGELLHFYAEDPGSSDLVYLMDRLNPEFMIIEVGNEGGIELYDLSVNKVQGLPIGKKDPPCSTEEDNQRALVQFIGNFGFFLWRCLLVMTVQVGLSINFNHIRHLTITEAFVVLDA